MVAVVSGRFGCVAAVVHAHEGIYATTFVAASHNESPCGLPYVDGQLFAELCDAPIFGYVSLRFFNPVVQGTYTNALILRHGRGCACFI